MKIMIDAGHNDSGYDTGAEGNGLREQDITYAVAKITGDILERAGQTVAYTRSDKAGIAGVTSLNDSLNKRSKAANDWGADLFISIHCNANADASASGTEVYCYKFGGAAEKLARAVNQAIASSLPLKNRGVKTANFAVLRQTSMPAILVETAFITNASDAAVLRDRQHELGRAIAQGVLNYLGVAMPQEPEGGKNKYSYDDTVNNLVIDGIIRQDENLWQNIANWEQMLSGKAELNRDYLRELLKRYHEKVGK